MANSYEGRTKIVLFDQSIRAIPLKDFQDNVSYPEQGKDTYDGYSIYDVTKEFAKHMITNMPDRYKLLGNETIDAQRRNANGSLEWIKIIPWKREKYSVAVMDDEGKQAKDANGKPMVEWKYNWSEVKDAK